MKILVTGSTGLVGSALVAALAREGHTVCRLVRTGSKTAGGRAGTFDVPWDPESGDLGGAAVGAEAVVNLGGAPIAAGRWTDARKGILRSSRVDATRALVGALGKMNANPDVLVSASAIGYYGNRGDEILTEQSAPGNNFLASLARDWEAEALAAEKFKTRVVLARFGIILDGEGGALAKIKQPFKLGFGGRLGDGRQWMSWIALEDVVAILRLAIINKELHGPLNVVAPEPVRNGEFVKELANVMHRPAIFPAPPFALRLAMGEAADEMLLASQRVIPEKLTRVGYSFANPKLDDALESIFLVNQ